jgi:hypothetical protein
MNATTCQSWRNTVIRSTSIVPAHGFGMGDVRPMASGFYAGTATLKRHADAVQATPVKGRQPWSPPVT